MHYYDFTIFSDLDGTLLPFYAQPTPQRNLDALKAFTDAGGRFAIATGRPAVFIEPMVKPLNINAPCILLNGCAIFDFSSGKYLHQMLLPEAARGYIEQFSCDWRNIGVAVTHDDPSFNYQIELDLIEHMAAGKQYTQDYFWRSLKERWFKAIFICHNGEECDAVEKYLRAQSFASVEIVRSSAILVEMLPKGLSKGLAIEKLYELGSCKKETTAAIGDYYNDIEIVDVSGIGACVKASPKELRAVSEYETCSCEDGAIADLIEYLMRKYP